MISPIIHTLRVQPHFFQQISLGYKTVEGRVFKPKYQGIQLGAIIRFQRSDQLDRFLEVRVAQLARYPTFRELLLKEGLEHCLPGVKSLEEGVKIYHSFPGFQADERKYGVVAIRIKKIEEKVWQV